MIEVQCSSCELRSSHSVGLGGELGVEVVLCTCSNCARFVELNRCGVGPEEDPLEFTCPVCGHAVREVEIDFGICERRDRMAQLLRKKGYQPRPPRPPLPIECPVCGQDAFPVLVGVWD